MSQLLQATCPKCGQGLRIPEQWTNALLRCKQCGQVIRTTGLKATAAANPPPVVEEKKVEDKALPHDVTVAADAPAGSNASPPAQAVGEPKPGESFQNAFAFAAPPKANGKDNPFAATDGAAAGPNPYLEHIRKGRKRRQLITLGVFGALAAAVGIGYLTDAHVWVIAQFRQWRDKTHSTFEGVVSHNDVPIETTPAATAPSAPAVGSAPAPIAPVAPKSAKYWGRGLLVGVKNYLYMNPLNPGYRGNQDLNKIKDPLGLTGLRQVLVKSMGFPAEQVAELSDVAVVKPYPPLKAGIMENVENFLAGSRPNDRVVLAFVCHAVEVEGKNYFVPMEGEPEKEKVDTLIPVEWLYQQLAKCPSKHKLVILDLSPFDPEQGSLRQTTGPLSKKLEEELSKPPENTLVWLSCSGEEHSYQFAANGFPGSVFMRFVLDCGLNIIEPKNRRRWTLPADAKEASIALINYIPQINNEISKYIKDRIPEAKQTPKLFGSDNPDPDPALPEPPPALLIQAPKGADALAEAKVMEGIFKELSMVEDASQAIGPETMPPFWAKNMEPYKADDYTNEKELTDKLAMHPLRSACFEAAKMLRKHQTSFRTSYRYNSNDAQFAKMLESQQEEPAKIAFDLEQALDVMEKAGKERAKETSKRWQANFDFVYSRLLGRLAYAREYNFVIGNRLRKDKPALKDPKNNTGWNVVPQERVQDKEAKVYVSKRNKALDRLLKDHPDTPWAILARKDLSTNLGLTIQEAKVE
jgi:hypothetical protein